MADLRLIIGIRDLKTDKKIIQTLNSSLKLELTAINLYFLHSRIANHWGLGNLGEVQYKSSIAAMKVSDGFIDRILFLQGLPNLQVLGKMLVGESVPEMLNSNLWLTTSMREQLADSIDICESVQDFESRSILSSALDEAEEHIDWLESQIWLMDSMGLENYTQLQMNR